MTDLTPRSAARDSNLTPDAVAERSFTAVKRGYAESEVRAFLRLVADEFAAAVARERTLGDRINALEARLAAPNAPLSEQDLFQALGEETARVLRSARESATELRGKAEEHARRVVREAQETARNLRETAQHVLEERTREAEEAARARAKEIVGEARTTRDRLLADLAERRDALERQIVELRGGRTHLVETYQNVERVLAQAARALAEEPRGVTHEPRVEVPARESDVEAPHETPEPAAAGPAAPATDEALEATDTADMAAGDTASAAGDAGAASGPDVHALFEKLRAGKSEPEAEASEPEPSTEAEARVPSAVEADQPEEQPGPQPESESEPESPDSEAPVAEATATEAPADEAEPEPAGDERGPDAPLLDRREEALAGPVDELSRRGKRALQDEQNDVLDSLRRQRGKIDLTKLLPARDDQVTRWAHVLQPAVDVAYVAGAATTGPAKPPKAAPRSLLQELAGAVVDPLRERLSTSIASVEGTSPADTEIAVAQRIGARYREWRAQDLDGVLGDALAGAYSRGVYDAAAAGARLRWVPATSGKCPDCDDNALEPTVKGSQFPTGQTFPPAHPGCRCLLVVDVEA